MVCHIDLRLLSSVSEGLGVQGPSLSLGSSCPHVELGWFRLGSELVMASVLASCVTQGRVHQVPHLSVGCHGDPARLRKESESPRTLLVEPMPTPPGPPTGLLPFSTPGTLCLTPTSQGPKEESPGPCFAPEGLLRAGPCVDATPITQASLCISLQTTLPLRWT